MTEPDTTPSAAYIFGERVTAARQLRGLTRSHCASQLGLSTASLRSIEGATERTKISRPLLLQMCLLLRFPEGWFYKRPVAGFKPPRFMCQSAESRCQCGETATKLCDHVFTHNDPVECGVIGKTCNAPICSEHAQTIGKMDYCGGHRIVVPRARRGR